jgi:SAM-dependent methyltransferase
MLWDPFKFFFLTRRWVRFQNKYFAKIKNNLISMKVRDSGMPEEKLWSSFFNVDLILSELEINKSIIDLVEIGFGYGTFTIPAANSIKGNLYAFDLEKDMLQLLSQKNTRSKTTNIIAEKRDILESGTGLEANSVDYVMLFNILHHNNPNEFLNEARRILKPKGKIGIIHWRSDIPTPRGPEVSSRPKPDNLTSWIDITKFDLYKAPFIFEPYHFGLILAKK